MVKLQKTAVFDVLGMQQKNTTVNQLITVVNVTRPGFEPRHSESESDVLPLYYRAVLASTKQVTPEGFEPSTH
jgi:hypothetical protein